MAITQLHSWLNDAGFQDTPEGGAELLSTLRSLVDSPNENRRPIAILLSAMRWYSDLRQCLFPVTFSLFLRDYYGIRTIEEFIVWCANPTYPKDIDRYLAILDPRVDIELEKEVSWGWLKERILASGLPIEPACKWQDPDDLTYGVVSRAMLDKIMAKSPVNKLPFIADARDCDDFGARLFRGWLAYCGDGRVALDGHFNVYQGGAAASAHVMNVWVLGDGSVCVMEPQTSSVFPVSGFLAWYPNYRLREVRA